MQVSTRWKAVRAALATLLALTGPAALLEAQSPTPCSTQPPLLIEAREDVSDAFPGAPRLQSFAFAQQDGKWVFIAGRVGGFHGFNGGINFPPRQANKSIWVIDPGAGGGTAQVYSLPLAALPASLALVKAQWASSNPLYYQDGDTLYIAGGYGPDPQGRYVTFPVLSSVSLPALIQGVMQGKDTFSSTIAWTQSPLVQSTGGQLLKLDDGLFYLVMGQIFSGFYGTFLNNNQQNTPEASQQYLPVIRKLAIRPGGPGQLSVRGVASFRDSQQFARRDLNVAYTILPDGSLGIGAYGGVFTPNPLQLNYVFPIYLSKEGSPLIDTSYEQKMSSYECAKVVFYDAAARASYTTFFGGISRWSFDYTLNEFRENPRIGDPSKPVFSDGMPWIDTITTLCRYTQSGKTSTTEIAQPAANRLPAYLGSEALFIPVPGLKRYRPDGEIYDLSQLPPGEKVLIGYIFGGIRATPFKSDGTPYNSGQTPTIASDLILKVYATRPAS